MRLSSCRIVSAAIARRTLRRGVTLLELLVVLAIMGILAAILLPAVQAARQAAHEMQDANHVRQLSLAIHQHVAAFDRLPGPLTGNCGVTEGWTFAVLAQSEQNNVLNAFDSSQPLDFAANLRVAEQPRPVIFTSVTAEDTPYLISATDDMSAEFSVRPTHFAFNGWLLDKRLEHIPSTSQTALFARVGPCGLWVRSPEFYLLQPPPSGELVLIGFADGSVNRVSVDSVMIEA